MARIKPAIVVTEWIELTDYGGARPREPALQSKSTVQEAQAIASNPSGPTRPERPLCWRARGKVSQNRQDEVEA